MDVRLAGSGPAAEAVEAALSDLPDARPMLVDADELGGADLAVACDEVGGSRLATASRSARAEGTPLVAVETGGIGGRAVPEVEAAVVGFPPDAGCYGCLRTRVAAGGSGAGDPPDHGDPGTKSSARLAGAIAGREAVNLLSGSPSPLVRSLGEGERLAGVIELPHALRTLLPVPGCECSTGHDPSFDRTHRPVPLDDALERAELALDERIGPIAQVGEAESFPAPYYLATVSETTTFSDAAAPGQAAGVDPDWNRAFMKALGEGLERYSAAVYRTDAMRRAPPSAMVDGVDPDAFVRPDDAPAVDPDDPIRWSPAMDLTDGSVVHLPAEAVRFPPPEERYLAPITTGLGLGNSPVEAALSGLYEVIERDATMVSWYSTFEPLELRVADEDYRALARRARSEDLAVTSLLVTVDVDVPVVASAVHRADEWPAFAVGSEADLDAAAAARAALAEAIQNWMELRSMGPDAASRESTAIGRYADRPPAADDFLDAGGPVPASEVGPDPLEGTDELDAAVAAVADAGLAPYVTPLAPRDVDRIGFSAVRVTIPGAQPLFTDRPAFGDRAREVPRELGFEPDLDREKHPYP